MISVEDHMTRILTTVRRLDPTEMPIGDALGAVVAADVRSRVPLPGFDNAAMDGYAVRSDDTVGASTGSPVRLTVVGDIAAGDTRELVVEESSCYRIMTGAPVPIGADAVVKVEDTDAGRTVVSIRRPAAFGEHVRPQGEDVHPGDTVLRDGDRLGARQTALAAAVGAARVTVTPVPRVVVLTTGDELVPPGKAPGFGQVVDSNGAMLRAALLDLGVIPYLVSGVRDDPDTVTATLRAQLVRADAVITTGGVSMGAYDAVKEALSSLGAMRFDQVAMQPGKPQGFGTVGAGDTPVFALPGNPASVLVSFEVFVAPALRQMAGRAPHETQLVRAVAQEAWTSPEGKVQFARATLTRTAKQHTVALAGGQGSHMMTGLAQANALAVVPAHVTRVEAGQAVSCLPLGPVPIVRASSAGADRREHGRGASTRWGAGDTVGAVGR